MDKLKVCYIYRNRGQGNISIEKVFGCIEEQLNNTIDIIRIEVPEYKVTPLKLIENIKYCHKKAKEINADIYHITGDIHYVALGLPGKNTILTIHDIVLLNYKNSIKRAIFKLLWFKLPLRRCDSVTAISKKTKDDLNKLFPKFSKKVEVIENPLIGNYTYCPKKIHNSNPRILQIGARENKNLIRVTEALNGIQCNLRIIGKLSNEQIESLKMNHINYSNSFDITDDELIKEYEDSDIVIFASTFEGFGLPIIEAQAVGRPVVTSNIEPMTDVAGDGACFVDPFSVDSIKKGIIKVLTDTTYANQIVKNGKNNVERFKPSNIANYYLKLYHEVLKV